MWLVLWTSDGALWIRKNKEHIYKGVTNRGKQWKQSPLYMKHLSLSLPQPFSQKARLAEPLLPPSELPLNCPLIFVLSLTNVPTGAARTCTNPSLGKTAINNHEAYRASAHTRMVEDSHNIKIASSPRAPASNHAWLSREPLTQILMLTP